MPFLQFLSYSFWALMFVLFYWKIIKEWNTELQERTGKFRKQATAIAEWDKKILQNRDVLLRLEVIILDVINISYEKSIY